MAKYDRLHLFNLAVEKEVEERRAFQREMESLGKGHEYRTIIETEISRVSIL